MTHTHVPYALVRGGTVPTCRALGCLAIHSASRRNSVRASAAALA